MYQLLNGLKCIHQKNIAHRDLKPENVLLSTKGIIKICDFGSSKVLDPLGKNTPYIVSRYYRAPELMLCLTKYTTAIDVWAAGCIMAELFLLMPLFKGKSEGDQLFAIFRIMGSMNGEELGEYKQRVPFDPSLFDSFGKFKRVNLKELFRVVNDKNNFLDLLLKMLAYLPEKRITASEALKHPFFDDIEGSTSAEQETK
jgi:glycogen synthase kinase 3 beta